MEREQEKDSCQIMAWNGVMSEVQQRENTAFLTSRVSEGYSWQDCQPRAATAHDARGPRLVAPLPTLPPVTLREGEAWVKTSSSDLQIW